MKLLWRSMRKRYTSGGQFRLFHLTDQETREIEYHYHDFDKITIFIKGQVTQMPWKAAPAHEIVLVKDNDLHRLTVDNRAPYERIIVYISPAFIEAYQTSDYDLSFCFQKAYEEGSNVLRIPSLENFFGAINRLEQSFSDQGYAATLYRQLLFLEFMVHLNRAPAVGISGYRKEWHQGQRHSPVYQ